MKLKNKVAIITGSTSGIGAAAGEVFSEEGASVVITGRRRTEGQALLKKLEEKGAKVLYFQADVTVPKDVEHLVAAALSQFGKVDILFNNAGINPVEARTGLAECPENAWDEVIRVNLKGIYHCSRAVVPVMIKCGGGVILNTASTFGLVGFPKRSAYIASKGAVVQLTRSMAVDYGTQNIRVNCICPGMVLTERVKQVVQAAKKDGRLSSILADYPLRRLGSTTEIAKAACFLVSDDASWITGAALPVDGGFTAAK